MPVSAPSLSNRARRQKSSRRRRGAIECCGSPLAEEDDANSAVMKKTGRSSRLDDDSVGLVIDMCQSCESYLHRTHSSPMLQQKLTEKPSSCPPSGLPAPSEQVRGYERKPKARNHKHGRKARRFFGKRQLFQRPRAMRLGKVPPWGRLARVSESTVGRELCGKATDPARTSRGGSFKDRCQYVWYQVKPGMPLWTGKCVMLGWLSSQPRRSVDLCLGHSCFH